MRENLQIVRNYIDANILLEKGYELKRIAVNKDDFSKLIFFFNYEDGIRDELKRISITYKTKK